MSETLPAELRRNAIAELIAERGFVRVAELADRFGISGVTARADLDALVDTARARRVHGGAMPPNDLAPRPEREWQFEEALNSSAAGKERVGSNAAALVRSGNTVIVDVGTTGLAVARALAARADLTDVTVITNSLTVALALEPHIPRFTVIVTGGTLRPRQHSLVAPFAAPMLDQLHADLAFIGCNGVDGERGVTNINLPEAEVKRLMMGAAERVVIVADAAKLGQVHLGRIATLDDVDLLVTDDQADAALVEQIAARGVRVITGLERTD